MSKKDTKQIITDEMQLADRAVEIDTSTQNKEMREIISALKATIKANNISALSAPAIGYNRRIFCVSFSDSEIKTFINPIIIPGGELTISKETCTSIPGKTFIIPRNTEVSVMYQDPLGRAQSRKLKGVAASVFQHEIHHLDGLLISDIGLEIDKDFENASLEEQEEVIKAYLESLDLTSKALQEEIQNNEELKRLSDGIEFITKVQTGEVELIGDNPVEKAN